MFIDTHAHIYVKEFGDQLHDIISNAKENEVTDIFMPNIDASSMSDMLMVANNYPSCHPMIGLHPCHVFADYKSQIDAIWKFADVNQFYAVGEIGIDLYWDKTFYQEQIDAFRWQISKAKEAGLPFVIHSRDALDLTISTVQDMQDGSLKGIFHCFGGDLVQAHKILDVGFLLGIGGVVTYKNSGLDTVISEIPLEHIVLETDAPYLSPIPHRGKRNEPAFIRYVAAKLAETKNVAIEEVAIQTSYNAKKLFFQ